MSDRRRGRTEIARLERMTDEEAEAAAVSDSDNPPAAAAWLKNAKLVERPRKEAISIRIDGDVLAWYRAQGSGYQSLMNAVLRSYMNHTAVRDVSRGAGGTLPSAKARRPRTR